jgi:hypothetical protein
MLSARPAWGAEPARRALEVDVYGGLLRRNGLSVTDDTSTRNGGAALALGAHYRTAYFLAPFAEVAYYTLAASDRVVDLGSGPVQVLNRSWAFGFTSGFALDVWRLRLRAGLGLYDLVVRTETPGARSTVSELDFGYVAGATFYPLLRDRVRLGIEARVGLVVEGQVGFIALGATLGADAISF